VLNFIGYDYDQTRSHGGAFEAVPPELLLAPRKIVLYQDKFVIYIFMHNKNINVAP